MDPAQKHALGRSGVAVTRLGFGGVGIGNLRLAPDEGEVRATLAAAWSAGIRYFDSAASYGNGLSEHRLGSFLHSQPRAEVVLSSKVGKLLRPTRQSAGAARATRPGLPFDIPYDYSYAGIMRAYDDCLQRLGLAELDVLVVHDLDPAHLAPDERFSAHLDQLVTSGWRAIDELRASGRVRAIGIGINDLGLIPRFLDLFDPDFFLLAFRYTLMEQDVLDLELPLCQQRDVAVVAGAVFNSGLTVMGPVEGARYDYQPPTAQQCEHVRLLHAVCARHGVPPAAAALQFPLGHPSVVAVLAGFVSPGQVHANIADFSHPIPADFWAELKHAGLLREDAPVPVAPATLAAPEASRDSA